MKMMPNFFIVGAARSGTTSLDRYLSQHPEIYIPRGKEVHFFAAEHFPCTGPGDERLNKRVIHDQDHYAQLFTEVRGEKAIGEASVFYLSFAGTAERIAQAVPDAKIIISLREPVERAYSAYMHLVRDGRETLGFAEGLSQEQERKQKGFEPLWWYKELSLYYEQVKRYLEVFGRERVKVLLYDELCDNPGQMLREVFVFLGVKEDVDIDTSVRYNVSGVPKSRRLYTLMYNCYALLCKFVDKPSSALAHKALSVLLRRVPMNEQIQAQLKADLVEDVGRLEELLQRDLNWWQHQHPFRINL